MNNTTTKPLKTINMKVKELIELLSMQNPDKEVMIQQEGYQYAIPHSVKEIDIDCGDDFIFPSVVIEKYSQHPQPFKND